MAKNGLRILEKNQKIKGHVYLAKFPSIPMNFLLPDRRHVHV
jgi:hypothetical protein